MGKVLVTRNTQKTGGGGGGGGGGGEGWVDRAGHETINLVIYLEQHTSYQCIHRTFGIYRRRFGDPGYRDQLLHEVGQIVPLNFSCTKGCSCKRGCSNLVCG